jgi:hypothetical protein
MKHEEFNAWASRSDRFDGFDRGDLDNDYEAEQQAKNEYEAGPFGQLQQLARSTPFVTFVRSCERK